MIFSSSTLFDGLDTNSLLYKLYQSYDNLTWINPCFLTSQDEGGASFSVSSLVSLTSLLFIKTNTVVP